MHGSHAFPFSFKRRSSSCFESKIIKNLYEQPALARILLSYKELNGPKADPVELNLWNMIPISLTTRAMLDPEADAIDDQTDTSAHDGLY